MQRFHWILAAYLFSVLSILKGSEGSNICMSWEIRRSQLIIDCQVQHLHFEVSIFGPLGDLQAHCLSPVDIPSCTSLNIDGHVEQFLLTNTTVYTLFDRDISRFNGRWKCQHGSSKDNSSIKVTISKVVQNGTIDQTCYEQFVTWTMIGFVPSFIILRVLLWSVSPISKKKEKMLKSCLPLCTCVETKQQKSAIVCRRIVILLISSYFFLMPIMIGFLEKTTCKATRLFSLSGVICGLLINIVWCDDDQNVGGQNDMYTDHTIHGNTEYIIDEEEEQ